LNKEFTSAKIVTKQAFTYGRFEIRAALPKGKLLRSAIFMISESLSEWARNGQIDIMTNVQNKKLGAGLHYNVPSFYAMNSEEFSTDLNLNDFHIYSLEWNQFEIKWGFDNINHLTININQKLGSIYSRNGQPFDRPFKVVFQLGVGPFGKGFFPSTDSVYENVKDWLRPIFIIDYVKIYRYK
jgi:beta-glucanase (GH16 family)